MPVRETSGVLVHGEQIDSCRPHRRPTHTRGVYLPFFNRNNNLRPYIDTPYTHTSLHVYIIVRVVSLFVIIYLLRIT